MNYMTVRNIDPDLARALEDEKRRRGKSINQTVIELLRQALSLDWKSKGANGLEKLAGTWSQDEFESFERATAVFEQIDAEQWQ